MYRYKHDKDHMFDMLSFSKQHGHAIQKPAKVSITSISTLSKIT